MLLIVQKNIFIFRLSYFNILEKTIPVSLGFYNYA